MAFLFIKIVYVSANGCHSLFGIVSLILFFKRYQLLHDICCKQFRIQYCWNNINFYCPLHFSCSDLYNYWLISERQRYKYQLKWKVLHNDGEKEQMWNNKFIRNIIAKIRQHELPKKRDMMGLQISIICSHGCRTLDFFVSDIKLQAIYIIIDKLHFFKTF